MLTRVASWFEVLRHDLLCCVAIDVGVVLCYCVVVCCMVVLCRVVLCCTV